MYHISSRRFLDLSSINNLFCSVYFFAEVGVMNGVVANQVYLFMERVGARGTSGGCLSWGEVLPLVDDWMFHLNVVEVFAKADGGVCGYGRSGTRSS